MTVDLGTQIRDYAQTVDAAQEPLRIDDLMVDDYPQADQSTSPSEQNRLRVAVVAAVILVATGVIVVAVDTDSNTDVAGPTGDVEVLPFLDGLATPTDVVFDPTGGLYVLEHHGLSGVSRVDILPDGSAGERVVVASATDPEGPERMALDDSGTLYFNDYDTVIRVPDPSIVASSTATVFFATGTAATNTGLAIDAHGDLYFVPAVDSGSQITRVAVLDDGSAGTVTEIVTVPGRTSNVAFGPTGELFFTNDWGEIWVVAFTDDGSLTSLRRFADMPAPLSALAFDPSGNLYVGMDTGTVWSIDPAGEPTLVATGFEAVAGLAFDASGTLYVADAVADEVLRVVSK